MSSILRPPPAGDSYGRRTRLRVINGADAPSEGLGDVLGQLADVIDSTIAVCLTNRVAIMFSATSSGGAISVTAYLDDERVRGYASNADELRAVLSAVLDAAEAQGMPRPVPRQNGPGSASQRKA